MPTYDELLLTCVDAQAVAGQPAPLYAAIDAAIRELVGHKLFTMMVLARDGERVRRVYSNQPSAYPVGGFKTHRQTPWGRKVLGAGEPYIGRNRDDIRWAFADHELIFSLGCESILNMPVGYDGRVLGTVNVLDAAEHYREAHVALVKPFCALLIPAFQYEIAQS
jgi:hypothetical protein